MRILLLILLLIFTLQTEVRAQNDLAKSAFENGINAARAEKFDEALRDFQNLLANEKNSNDLPKKFRAQINYNIGVCLYRLNRPNEAVGFVREAVRLGDGKYRNAFYLLGMTNIELQNWQAAKDAFRAAIRLKKGGDAESWFDLGRVYLREQNFTEAAEAFENAIRYKSVDLATALNNIGVIAAFDGDWTKAEKQFEKALEASDGKLPEAENNLKFCRSQNTRKDLTAKLEFVRKIK